MAKKIFTFKQFINESYSVNEGIFDFIPSLIGKVKGWASTFYQSIKDGLISKITEGPNKGKPAAMLFLPENGSILSQVNSFYGVKTNEAKIPLEYIPFVQMMWLE